MLSVASFLSYPLALPQFPSSAARARARLDCDALSAGACDSFKTLLLCKVFVTFIGPNNRH